MNLLKLKCFCPNQKTDFPSQSNTGGCSYSNGKSVNMQNSDRKPCSIIHAKFAFRHKYG